MKTRLKTRQRLRLYNLGRCLCFLQYHNDATKLWEFIVGTIWHPSTARSSKGRGWVYTYAGWGPNRCHDLETQPCTNSCSSGYHIQLHSPPCLPAACLSPPKPLDFYSLHISLARAIPSPVLHTASLSVGFSPHDSTPQRHPCSPPLRTKASVKRREVFSNQKSQFTSHHILQLSFMPLPSCSGKHPLLGLFYFHGAHLAAAFSISPQNYTHLISHVNLLTVCRGSEQQHSYVFHEHFTAHLLGTDGKVASEPQALNSSREFS